MCLRFRRLGTPMSSQTPLAWAASTSSLVGALKIWQELFDAARRSVESILIPTCDQVNIFCMWEQSPLNTSRMSPPAGLRFLHTAQIRRETLVIKTQVARKSAAEMVTCQPLRKDTNLLLTRPGARGMLSIWTYSHILSKASSTTAGMASSIASTKRLDFATEDSRTPT